MQYGLHRTATTLQSQTLCVILLLLHAHEPEKVVCHFWHNTPMEGVHETNCRLHTGSPRCFEVAKTHSVDIVTYQAQNVQPNASSRAALFATAAGGPSDADWRAEAAKLSRELAMHVSYVQTTGRVAQRGHHAAHDYAPIFGLDRSQMAQLLEYLRFWQPLRQCCGAQMSSDWMSDLIGLNETSAVPYTPHHTHTDAVYPACEVCTPWASHTVHNPCSALHP